MLGIFVVLVTFFLLVDPSNLPDYESYERIFHRAQLCEEWEIFFVMVNYFFLEYGLAYSDLRTFILIFSSFGLWLILSRFHRIQRMDSVSISFDYLIVVFFVLAVFMFEYFIIRIRAGFAMGLIFYAYLFLMSPRVMLGWIFAALFFVMAFFTHKFTSVILAIFLMFPYIAGKWNIHSRWNIILYNMLSMIAVAYLLYSLHSSFEIRGENLYSPLNPVRFVMLSIIPLILVVFIKNESNIAINSRNATPNFSFYFVRFYTFLAVGLALMFLASMTDESGEALVRLYTLSSIPALLSFQLSGSIKRAPVSGYILLINALFFLATIF